MLSDAIVRFLLFWAIWALVPMAVDGVTALSYLGLMFRRPRRAPAGTDGPGTTAGAGPAAIPGDASTPERDAEQGLRQRRERPPTFVSVVVPIYNAEGSLLRCLKALAAQTYPARSMEVLCVGNGVNDHSARMYGQAQVECRDLNVTWVDLTAKGKSKALNAGVYMARGSLVFTVDADTRLAPDAIERVVRAMEEDDRIGGACGSIMVDLMPPETKWWWMMVNACEVMEYLSAFRIGRRYQSMRNALFTLSGAFSVFRREALLGTHRYDDTTVSEDTKVTFDVRNLTGGKWRIACIPEARAYVEPTTNLARFLAQRLRWQRGELEVLSLYPHYYRRDGTMALKDFGGRLLLADHTLSFPRLTWTFLIPFMFFLGYSLPLVALALWITYFLYILIDLGFLVSVGSYLRKEYGVRMWQWWFLPLVMPAYRTVLWWPRLAGMIYALNEPAAWAAEGEGERVAKAFTALVGGVRRVLRAPWNRLKPDKERPVTTAAAAVSRGAGAGAGRHARRRAGM